jgi:hypothetical protein
MTASCWVDAGGAIFVYIGATYTALVGTMRKEDGKYIANFSDGHRLTDTVPCETVEMAQRIVTTMRHPSVKGFTYGSFFK